MSTKRTLFSIFVTSFVETLKEGDSVLGVIIGHDYEKRFLHICLRPDITGKISKVQDGGLNVPISTCYAEKLMVKDECIVSILRHPNGNKQLVYLPVKLHENDFVGCMSYYNAKKFKICVCGCVFSSHLTIKRL